MLLNGLLSKCPRLFRTYFRWLGHTHPWKVAQPLSWNGSPLSFGPFEVLVHPEEVSCYKLNAFSSCTCATHVTFVTQARFANSFSKHFTQISHALAFHVYTFKFYLDQGHTDVILQCVPIERSCFVPKSVCSEYVWPH